METCKLARRIWEAGVDRVRADRLIAESVSWKGAGFRLGNQSFELGKIRNICIVGAGKAAGYLGVALVDKLVPFLEDNHRNPETSLGGWINVPANCVVDSSYVRLHAARPAGVNEPRAEGVEGTREILERVGSLQPDDLCICLLTGGGSALLPAPTEGISLDDKLLVTRLLSSRGASIQELNGVRIALSDVKGGGLTRACKAGHLVTLIVSDIIGDPLPLIASGPTIEATIDESPLDILKRYASSDDIPRNVWDELERPSERKKGCLTSKCQTLLLGNNQTAVDAAQIFAQEQGLETIVLEPETPNTSAEDVGIALIETINRQAGKRSQQGFCILWGGEPIVQLHESAGKGGRNQQLALAALDSWKNIDEKIRSGLCILSGGTDGEDGPTDAAGAFVDDHAYRQSVRMSLNVKEALLRNNAYPVFEELNSLVKTGPTHTNVCDLRIAVCIDSPSQST